MKGFIEVLAVLAALLASFLLVGHTATGIHTPLYQEIDATSVFLENYTASMNKSAFDCDWSSSAAVKDCVTTKSTALLQKLAGSQYSCTSQVQTTSIDLVSNDQLVPIDINCTRAGAVTTLTQFSFNKTVRITKNKVLNGLVLWVHMNNDANDYSGKLTQVGKVNALLTLGKDDLNFSGYQFNGVDSNIPYTFANQPKDLFTISFWANPAAAHEIDGEGMAGVGGTSGERYALWGSNRTSDGTSGTEAELGISVGTNGISVYEHADNYMPAVSVYAGALGSTWKHIVIVYQNKRATIYVNGSMVHTGVQSAKNTTFIGTQLGGGVYGHFSGTLDEVMIWNKALTPADINYLYYEQKPQ